MTLIRKYFDVRRLVTYHNTGLTDIFDGVDKRGEGQFFPIRITTKAKVETFTDKTIISFDSAECHVQSSGTSLVLACMKAKKEDGIPEGPYRL